MNREMTMMDYINLQPETMQEIFDKRADHLKAFLEPCPEGGRDCPLP